MNFKNIILLFLVVSIAVVSCNRGKKVGMLDTHTQKNENLGSIANGVVPVNAVSINNLPIIGSTNMFDETFGKPDSVTSFVDEMGCFGEKNKEVKFNWYKGSKYALTGKYGAFVKCNLKDNSAFSLRMPSLEITSKTNLADLNEYFPIAVQEANKWEEEGILKALVRLPTDSKTKAELWVTLTNGVVDEIYWWFECNG